MIVTNNPMVADKYRNTCLINGSVADTLLYVRDLVYEGYELITHPLAASHKMIHSSCLSVVLGKRLDKVDFLSAQIIANSIIKFKRLTDHRKKNLIFDGDYQRMDLILLESALYENRGFLLRNIGGRNNETGDWPDIYQGYPVRTGNNC